MSVIQSIVNLHNSVFYFIQKLTRDWLLGLSARLVFCSVLFMYFINSAQTKIEGGIWGFLTIKSGAYAQILPPIAEQYGYDSSAIPLFPWGIIVFLGTYAEFILPVLILLGLFTRIASIGLIVFIAVMTFVDINFHGVDAQTIGAFFDKVNNSAIADQRLLWIMPLLLLVISGPGKISADYILGLIFGDDRK